MPCMGPDLDFARQRGEKFYEMVENILRMPPYSLGIDPPTPQPGQTLPPLFAAMNLRCEMERLKAAIVDLFEQDAIQSF